MIIATIRGLVVVALFVVSTLQADMPYVGKWKFNSGKSTLTGDTVTIENTSGGMMQFNAQGFNYKFKLDGKEYPMPDGGTTAWTATSNDVWDVTNRLNGKVTVTYHLALKGDTLTVGIRQMKPDGGTVDANATYARVSGGPGFLGNWRSTEVKMPSTLLEIVANGMDGVTLKDETGFLISGRFDGKDNPAMGKLAGSKYTFEFKKVSGSSFELTTKLDGKSLYVEVYTASPDGKVLTVNGTPSNAKQETYKIVYDRQ